MIVSGTAVVNADDPAKTMTDLRNQVAAAIINNKAKLV
jgi:hypothetical protein